MFPEDLVTFIADILNGKLSLMEKIFWTFPYIYLDVYILSWLSGYVWKPLDKKDMVSSKIYYVTENK